MKSFGTLYADILKYPHRKLFPIAESGWTTEIEHPYRDGSCIVLRFPGAKRGLILGIWDNKSASNETDALIKAVGARQIDLNVVSDLRDPVWEGEDVLEK
jgi:hypothetical protein